MANTARGSYEYTEITAADMPNVRDWLVPHRSTVPANSGDPVQLFVRELDGTHGSDRKAVLMLHGRSIPALAGFDLNREYSWAQNLAGQGFDVFVMDLQGSGRSPRPKMDDACNANPIQHSLLIPNPLRKDIPPNYTSQLNNSKSDWDELHTVVNWIKANRHVDQVALIGWSAAAFQIGPYTLQHPENVSSIVFLAPVFPPFGRKGAPGPFDSPVSLPLSSPPAQFGFPMNISTKASFQAPWNSEQHCPRQREDGIVDVVWDLIMKNDEIGSQWGPEKSGGLMRIRNALWWGWNRDTVGLNGVLGERVPVLIVYGALDVQANTAPNLGPLYFSVPELYNAIPGQKKLMVRVDCTGHCMVWERQHKHLYRFSREWLRKAAVDGVSSGSFFFGDDGFYPNETGF
jgi:pimeloyl-ACP methyl ester carboxylesterase